MNETNIIKSTNDRIRAAWQRTGASRWEFGDEMGLPVSTDSRGQKVCPTLDSWLRPADNKAYRDAPESMARLAEFVAEKITQGE